MRKRVSPEAREAFQAYCAKQVAEYRRIGQYPDQRIKRDRDGVEYVIGDISWNRRGAPREFIDDRLP